MRRRIYPSWWGRHPHCTLPCLGLSFLSLSWLLSVYWAFKCWWYPGFFPFHFSFHIILSLWPIYKYGFSYPWSMITSVFPALMALLNFGPFYPLHISNRMSPTIFIIFFWNLRFCWNNSINQPVTQTRNLETLLDFSPLSSFPSPALLFLSCLFYLLYVANPVFLLHPHCVLFNSSLSKPTRTTEIDCKK